MTVGKTHSLETQVLSQAMLIFGGAEKIDYYFLLGTEENNGYTVQSNFNRKTARLKVNATEIADSNSTGR